MIILVSLMIVGGVSAHGYGGYHGGYGGYHGGYGGYCGGRVVVRAPYYDPYVTIAPPPVYGYGVCRPAPVYRYGGYYHGYYGVRHR